MIEKLTWFLLATRSNSPVFQDGRAVFVHAPLVLDVVCYNPLPIEHVDKGRSARFERVVNGLKHLLVVGFRLEISEGREHVNHRVETSHKRDVPHVAPDQFQRDSPFLGSVTCLCEIHLAQVKSGDFHPGLGQPERVPTVPATKIEDFLTGLTGQGSKPRKPSPRRFVHRSA